MFTTIYFTKSTQNGYSNQKKQSVMNKADQFFLLYNISFTLIICKNKNYLSYQSANHKISSSSNKTPLWYFPLKKYEANNQCRINLSMIVLIKDQVDACSVLSSLIYS